MGTNTESLREFEGYRLDVGRRLLWFGQETVPLQPKEVEILILLTDQPGQLVTKDELLEKVWAGSIVQETNLSRHIYRLRKLFESHGIDEGIIKTVPRRGYRFTAEVATPALVIERHAVSKTLIEEVTETGAERSLWPWAAALAVLLTAVFAVGAWYWSASESDSVRVRLVAVLPPLALSDDERDRFLSLGFADAMITGIGKLKEVKALSASAVNRYTDVGRDAVAIANELGADAVIDGTMQRSGDRIRVTMRITRIADGRQLWSGSFDETEANIFRLQDMLASRAVVSLAPGKLGVAESKRPTEDIEAYNLYLQAQYLFRRRETGPAAEFYRRAVNADPKFAEAWAGLAATSAMQGDHVTALSAVAKSLELDGELSLAHAVDGFLKLFVDWDTAAARTALGRALGIDPRSVEALHWMGILQSVEGDFNGAEEYIRKALELDPASANLYDDLGHAFYLAGNFREAERHFGRANELLPGRSEHRLLWIYELEGRDREFLDSIGRGNCRDFKDAALIEACTRPEVFGGDANRAVEMRRRLAAETGRRARDPQLDWPSKWYEAAIWKLRTGDKEEAVKNLRLAFENKKEFEMLNFTLPFVASDPIWISLRDDPRFIEMTKRFRPAR